MNTFALVLAIGGWIAGWLVGRIRRLPAVPSPVAANVSLIIPARNESERLPALLRTLDPSRIEVIVVDDSSDDDTALIAQTAGATVVTTSPPAGWTGKTFACWSGAQASHGDVLVFVDADVEATAAAIEAVASSAVTRGGMVSVQPFHRVERCYEYASTIPNLVAVMGAGTGSTPVRRWWRRPSAFGMVIAIPRSGYFLSGGHAAVRAAVAEDVALASVVARNGIPTSTWCGADGLRVRMYGEGPRQLFEGWRKNLATGASSLAPLRLLCVVAWISALAQASALVLVAPSITTAVVYAAFVAQTACLAGRVGVFRRAVIIALPLLVAAFVAIFVASAYATVRKRDVAWRGRPVATRSAR